MVNHHTPLPHGAPLCVRDTYALLLKELDRKRGMIQDLNQYAQTNYGLSPEDCRLLEQTVVDRDDIETALAVLRNLFA
jgi:hypothetical protein